MNNLDALLSPYTEAAPLVAPMTGLVPRHRADGPAEVDDRAWSQVFRPRHRADCLTGS